MLLMGKVDWTDVRQLTNIFMRKNGRNYTYYAIND